MDCKENLIRCCQRVFPCCNKQPPSTDAAPEKLEVIENPHANDQITDHTNRPLPALPTVKSLYVALYDYTPRTDDDLSFKTGDKLEILDKNHKDWWYAKALSGISVNKKGFVPANYLAQVESLDAEPWYFPDTKRADADKLLLCPGNEHGAFLIRDSESHRGELALSVLDNGVVKHYKVCKVDREGYYVSKVKVFQTLKQLVEHYSRDADGLCVRLCEPCKKLTAPQTHGLSYNTVDHWEIDRSSVKLLRKLGSGQFGDVFEGLWNNTTPVAVKTTKPGTMDPKDFLREAHIMKKLLHPNLIQLYAVCTLEEPIYIITELMRNGSLLEYLRKDRGSRLQLQDQVEMASQVASGMAYLELQNYIHRDLAARNVLVGENNICKVADFGLARVFMADNVYEPHRDSRFPVKWTAPEAIHYNKFSIKSDVWSFGVLLYEIVTFGQMPYPTMNNHQVVQKISTGYRMPCPGTCPRVLYGIMEECWNGNDSDRPTFETLQWKLEEYFELDLNSYADTNRFE